MSLSKHSGSKNTYNNNSIKKKPYNFFTIPNEILIEGEIYQLKDSFLTKIYFCLYEDDFLLYEDKSKNKFKGDIHFDFDLKLQWIFNTQKDKSFKSNYFKLVGFRFTSNDYYEEFQSQDEFLLTELKEILRKKINQLNFHDYYKAIKKLGKGNFASVYLVENKENDRKYAVKSFYKDQMKKEIKGKESVMNEITIMRKINHQNLIHLYEVHETENTIYMIMDFLEGGQLLELIKIPRKFKQIEIINLISGVAKGLLYLHEMGIIHRDIKPENILFNKLETGETEPVIVDFGLATYENENEYLFPRCGTPGYVAPEVINIKSQKAKYGAGCDIFSIGVLFHLLLLGKSPFNGKNYNDILAQNKLCAFSFDKIEYRSLNSEAFDLLKRMLEKDPDKRISSKEIISHPFLNHSFHSSFIDIDEGYGISAEENIKRYNEQELNFNLGHKNSFTKNPSKSPVSFKTRLIHRNNKTKETIMCDQTSNGSFKGGDSCISLVMRPALFGKNNDDSIEELNKLMSSKKSMTNHSHTINKSIIDNNENFSIWQKTNTNNTIMKKENSLFH